jgi:hypothetical protein
VVDLTNVNAFIKMPLANATVELGSIVAQFFYNLDSSRARDVSRDIRKLGWTEVWGENSDKKDNDNESSTSSEPTLSVQSPSSMILFQFRPAYLEQLLLRMARIPHTVVQSKYVAFEATGPLPCLQHGNALVGHRHPHMVTEDADSSLTVTASSLYANHILHYLQHSCPEYSQSKKEFLQVPPEKQKLRHLHSKVIRNLLVDRLQPACHALLMRDSVTWDQVYRPQYIAAAGGTAWGSRFQAWCVRRLGLRDSPIYSPDYAMRLVKESYDTIEEILRDFSPSLETPVDAMLWAHLADAVSSVHLVSIVAEYPCLVQFFQEIYQQYFLDLDLEVDYVGEDINNPFWEPQKGLPNPDCHNAVDFMHSLRPNWPRFLAAQRHRRHLLSGDNDKQQQNRRRSHKMRVYDWWDDIHMGESKYPPPRSSTTATPKEDPKDDAADERLQKARTSDQVWISCVVAVTTLAVLISRARE